MTDPIATTVAPSSVPETSQKQTDTKPVETKAPVDPKSPAASSDPEKTSGQLFKVVIKGKEQLVPYEKAQQLLQKELAGDRKLMEGAEAMKRSEALIEALKNDPESVLEGLGYDIDKLFASRTARNQKIQSMTPEQKEIAKIQAERDLLKQRVDREDEEKKNAARLSAQEKINRTYSEAMIKAAEANGLKDPDAVVLMAEVGLEALQLAKQYGQPELELTPDQIAKEVLFRQQENIRTQGDRLMSQMKGKPEELRKFLGEELYLELMKSSLKPVKQPASKPKTVPALDPIRKKKHITEAEFNIRQKKRDGID